MKNFGRKAAHNVRWILLMSLIVKCEAECAFSDHASEVITIEMDTCGMTTLNTAELTRFSNLQFLTLTKSKLATFPDLSSVGNTLRRLALGGNMITHINNDMLHPFKTLESLTLGGNQLTTIPNASASVKLRELGLCGNQIKQIKHDDVVSLSNLEILRLCDNARLTRFSHPVHHFRNIQFLNISRTGISHLPPILHENIGVLSLHVQKSVDVCKCENTWLKQEGPNMAAFLYDDADCDGQLWSNMTVQDMNAKCTQERKQTKKALSQVEEIAPLISLPPFLLHSFEREASKAGCTVKCMDTTGCVSYYWRRQQSGVGDCVLIAPGSSISVSSVPEGNLPVWTYFALTYM